MPPPIEEFLKQFRRERIYYIPNPGNAGDSIIAAATYQKFDQLGLQYETPNPQRVSFKGKVVIYGGGGNLIGTTTFSHRIISALHRDALRLVILPQTIKNIDSLAQSFGRNVDVICRERVSFNYVKTLSVNANVHLMDDMAVNLDPNAIPDISDLRNPFFNRIAFGLRKTLTRRNQPIYANIVRATRLEHILKRYRPLFNKDELFCLRTDAERTAISIPTDNVDLSEIFQFGVEDKDCAYRSARAVIDFLRSFKVIHTNRLHMAITGAVLGLKVNFYPNSYFKCREVYNFSLRDRFPNVNWID